MRILLAVDGSKLSEAATRTVITQARPQDTEVYVLHVIDVLSNQLPEMLASYPGWNTTGMRNASRRKLWLQKPRNWCGINASG